jgi:hypothetical protein
MLNQIKENVKRMEHSLRVDQQQTKAPSPCESEAEISNLQAHSPKKTIEINSTADKTGRRNKNRYALIPYDRK